VGSLTNIVYSGGLTTSPVALRYDGLGRLTNIVDGVGSTSFGWTDGGLLAYEDGPWSHDRIDYTYAARMRSAFSLEQENAGAWVQGYAYDDYRRLTNVTSVAGTFYTQYESTAWEGTSTASSLPQYLNLPGGSRIENTHDGLGRLLSTVLKDAQSTTVNSHAYEYNGGHQRTRQTFAAGNFVDYTYDHIGQLETAKGFESDGTTARPHEQFGYAYDAAWNLNYRTNNALVQTFGVDSLNQLTTLTRSGTMTVAGSVSTEPASVTVKDNNNAAQAATVYGDNTFVRANVTLLNGTNAFEAVAQDSYGRVDTNTVITWLPASATCYYDGRGNLTNDGRRVFFYDAENQLVTVLVSNAWKSDFVYDGFMRRRVRKEFAWSGGAWTQTNEVRYVYDGRLVVQERHYTPNGSTLIPLTAVTYTRGNDLSDSRQGAGGIGGLLARSEISNSQFPDAYYHADVNGNITALIASNGIVVARYNYDPYGNILAMSGPLAEANLYRFSSKEFHLNSGLVYYLYRYYEPHMQRWINRDPIGQAGGINLYVFVGNNGVFWIDAYGLHWTDYIPNILVDPGTVNFAAGMGDALSFGLTDLARSGLGINDQVNHCSGAYFGGQIAGTALSVALPAGGAAKLAGGADRVLAGTAKEGIYEFAGQSGRSYIGQSGNVAERLGQHLAKGKLPEGVNPTSWEVLGGKLARERAEQQMINSRGLQNLENIRNPLGGRPELYHFVPTTGQAAAAAAAAGAVARAAAGGGCH